MDEVIKAEKKFSKKKIALIVICSIVAFFAIVGGVLFGVFSSMYTKAFYSKDVQILQSSGSAVEEPFEPEGIEYAPHELVVEKDETVYYQNDPVRTNDIVVKIRYFDGKEMKEFEYDKRWVSGHEDATKNVGQSSITVHCLFPVGSTEVYGKVEVPLTVIEKPAENGTKPTGEKFAGSEKFNVFFDDYELDPLSVYSEQTLNTIKDGYINSPIYKKDQIDKSVFNFLIIGAGDTSDGKHKDLAESIIVVSIDKENKTVKAISLLSDTLVSIKGYGWNKLQVAYRIGGPGLLINTINDTFGLDIQHYVEADIQRLVKLVDELGGVSVNVTKEDIVSLDLEGVTAGEAKLTGKNLHNWLVYNGTGVNDITRTQRQSMVIKSLLSDFATGEKSFFNLISLCTKEKYVTTNLSFSKCFSSLYSVLVNLSEMEYTHHNIPNDIGSNFNYIVYKKTVVCINVPTAELRKMMNDLIG